MQLLGGRRKAAKSEGDHRPSLGASSPTPAAKRILVITGPGISAESGIPAFRGPGGRYSDAPGSSPAVRDAPVFAHDLLDRPGEVYAFVRSITQSSREASPNAGHLAIAACQQRLSERGGNLTLVTMNIDDLHERAGAATLHLHGRGWMDSCFGCDRVSPSGYRPGLCPNCGAHLRPDVVLFGEAADAEATWQGKRALGDAEAIYVVGTSGGPGVTRSWVSEARREFGAMTVLVCLDPNPLFAAEFDVVINDRAINLADYLPA